MTMRLAVFTVFVDDQDQALRFYVDRLGFVLSEDNSLGNLRWLLVTAPGTPDVAINLKLAETPDQRRLVGKQADSAPLLALTTTDCRGDYATMKARGVTFEGEPQTMPFGTGVLLKDLSGNRLYLNEELR